MLKGVIKINSIFKKLMFLIKIEIKYNNNN